MNALSIKDLRKKYQSGLEALRGITLDVKQGEFFGLLGPNGAGKTTTIGIITSLVTKTGGSVKVFGIDIDEDFPAAKRMIGVVPQEFNFSIFEKVEDIVCQQAGYYGIGRTEAQVRSEKYLRQLGLWEKRQTPARELSGGMKRRLMIARGLVHEPKLLILDEPTAGVDVELRRGMWDFLEKADLANPPDRILNRRLQEAEQLCSRIAIISDGRIIENASKRDLLKKLDKETFVLDVRAEDLTIEPLEQVIFNPLDETTLEVTTSRGQSLNQVFEHLGKQGIIVDSMRNKANRLEEIFMGMVE